MTVGPNNADTTSSGDFGGDLDMRAAVGHLTRNIKIEGEAGVWGGRVFSYLWRVESEDIDAEPIINRGQVNLHGVEFINMGQRDT